jgi:hypothetical protein
MEDGKAREEMKVAAARYRSLQTDHEKHIYGRVVENIHNIPCNPLHPHLVNLRSNF